MTNHVKQLEERLEIYRSKDTDKLTIQTFKELGTDKAYHICTFKQKELVPNVSQRGLPGESNTVLRVCVGLDILACIKGYSTTDKGWEDDSFKRGYFKRKNQLQKDLGEIGNSKSQLERQVSKYHNKTEHYYLLASKRYDFKENINKYAANVPHLMLYPKHGVINYSSVSKVVIGGDRNIAIENKQKPSFTKW